MCFNKKSKVNDYPQFKADSARNPEGKGQKTLFNSATMPKTEKVFSVFDTFGPAGPLAASPASETAGGRGISSPAKAASARNPEFSMTRNVNGVLT